MTKQMARKVPLAYTPERPIWEEDVVRWTWLDVVEFVAGTVILGSLIALVAFVTALAS